MTDVPIVPENYIYGLKVVDFGEARIKRGKSKRTPATCRHLNLAYDKDERRIYCEDCQSTVDAFDAFMCLVGWFGNAQANLDRRKNEVVEAEKKSLVSRAAKKMDELWRTRNLAPMCPHCHEALLPEDVSKGFAKCSRELARRKRENKNKPK